MESIGLRYPLIDSEKARSGSRPNLGKRETSRSSDMAIVLKNKKNPRFYNVISSPIKNAKTKFRHKSLIFAILLIFFFFKSTTALPFASHEQDVANESDSPTSDKFDEETTRATTLHRQQRSNVGKKIWDFIKNRCKESILDGTHPVIIKIKKSSCHKHNNRQLGSFSDEQITNLRIRQKFRRICENMVSNMNHASVRLLPSELKSVVDDSIYDC